MGTDRTDELDLYVTHSTLIILTPVNTLSRLDKLNSEIKDVPVQRQPAVREEPLVYRRLHGRNRAGAANLTWCPLAINPNDKGINGWTSPRDPYVKSVIFMRIFYSFGHAILNDQEHA